MFCPLNGTLTFCQEGTFSRQNIIKDSQGWISPTRRGSQRVVQGILPYEKALKSCSVCWKGRLEVTLSCFVDWNVIFERAIERLGQRHFITPFCQKGSIEGLLSGFTHWKGTQERILTFSQWNGHPRAVILNWWVTTHNGVTGLFSVDCGARQKNPKQILCS